MHEFLASHLPALESALAEAFSNLLDEVPGQTVYAAAIAHADGEAWRPDLNTEEAFAAVEIPDDLREIGVTELDYRWWPDDWTALEGDVEMPLLDEVRRIVDGFRDELDDVEGWYEAVIAWLVEGMDSTAVRDVFAARGTRPFLVVNNTDGEYDSALASFIALNADHPDRERFDEGRAHWQAEAGGDDAAD